MFLRGPRRWLPLSAAVSPRGAGVCVRSACGHTCTGMLPPLVSRDRTPLGGGGTAVGCSGRACSVVEGEWFQHWVCTKSFTDLVVSFRFVEDVLHPGA